MSAIPFSLALITAPTAEVVSYEDAKRQCRVEHDEDRALIEGFILAAAGQLDPAAGGWLGRALRPQTWEFRLAAFPCGALKLPYPPVTAISSIKYDDPDGVEQTFAPADYRLLGASDPGLQHVAPVYGKTWPAVRCQLEAVRIRFEAGYAPKDGDIPDKLPYPIRQWVLYETGTMYAHRESVAVGTYQGQRLPQVDGLVSHFRSFWSPPEA